MVTFLYLRHLYFFRQEPLLGTTKWQTLEKTQTGYSFMRLLLVELARRFLLWLYTITTS